MSQKIQEIKRSLQKFNLNHDLKIKIINDENMSVAIQIDDIQQIDKNKYNIKNPVLLFDVNWLNESTLSEIHAAIYHEIGHLDIMSICCAKQHFFIKSEYYAQVWAIQKALKLNDLDIVDYLIEVCYYWAFNEEVRKNRRYRKYVLAGKILVSNLEKQEIIPFA